jgi:benzoyl-CoA-dihydrodiol lyase
VITFERHPSRYRHWRLEVHPPLATLTLAVDVGGASDGGTGGDYELKLNSYDLGVDIELADAVERLRFEHPDVRCVVLTGGLGDGQPFCSGANIRMLGAARHPFKVNFCKFTNETRLAMEDAASCSGQHYLAALNGTASGGGYELALACEHILLVDDRNSAVSLPEVPLLGVLPGTGGLTRLTDKRRVRRDRVDWFATRAEGMRGADALSWGLVDELAPRSGWEKAVDARARALAAHSTRPEVGTPGLALPELGRQVDRDRVSYRWVEAAVDRARRVAEITVHGPGSGAVGIAGDRLEGAIPASPGDLGPDCWPLATARQLDDLLCHLRINEPVVATVVLRTRGDIDGVIAWDRFLTTHARHWLVGEITLRWKRTLQRLDLTARTLVAAIEPGSCFAGLLAELALAADRSFMLDGLFEDREDREDVEGLECAGSETSDGLGAGVPPPGPAVLVLADANFGALPGHNGLTRLQSRFLGDEARIAGLAERRGEPLDAGAAAAAGLVTFTPDDIDWEDELRLALEERAACSPDALTGLEANCRFPGAETMATKIFGRLSAWQNWIFQRPNAAGPEGALTRYGSGTRPSYDPDRT